MSSVSTKAKFVGFGLLFGFILVRVGATDFDAIAKMFLLEDLHLAGVIGVAVAVCAPAFYVLRRRGVVCDAGCSRTLSKKPVKPGLIVGSVAFGIGWALTGTCPGTSLAQLGEGKWMAGFTIVGILVGAGLHRRLGAGFSSFLRSLRHGAHRDSEKALGRS